MTIQFSNGKRQEIGYVDCNLFECWEQLEDEHHSYSDPGPGLIRLPYEGYHQTVFLNPEALDYVSFPTHKVEGGRVESYDDGLTDEGEIEAARDQGTTPRRSSSRRPKRSPHREKRHKMKPKYKRRATLTDLGSLLQHLNSNANASNSARPSRARMVEAINLSQQVHRLDKRRSLPRGFERHAPHNAAQKHYYRAAYC